MMFHRQLRKTYLILAGLVAGATIVPTGDALALQGGEDPALLPVLIDKRFGQGGRHQASLMFSTAMVTKFVEGLGAYGAYQYNFNDLFGLELSGGYLFSSETSIMEEIRRNFGEEPELSDQFQMVWMAQVDVMFVPVYGKISFASEVDPSFDLFFLAGGGVVGTQRKSGGFISGGGEAPTSTESSVGPAFNFGLGLRFYFSRLVAARLEFRNFFYPEPANYADPEKQVGGFTHNLHFQAGVQFAFGGDE